MLILILNPLAISLHEIRLERGGGGWNFFTLARVCGVWIGSSVRIFDD